MGGGVYRAHFGGAQRQRQHQQQQQQQAGVAAAPSNPLVQLVQMLPLLLLLFFSFFGNRSQPAYSLTATRDYRQQMATAAYEVPFWVRDAQQLHSSYPPGSRER